MNIDYSKVGLKTGLEVHQQLDTETKLFCSCQPKLFKEEPEIAFLRRLRPTQSELGQIDPAAFFEFQKGVKILYEANRETSCLVEMDEEPPHDLNQEAVEISLTAALMMNAKPLDEIHVMRKTVIDGSNTTGFQRTCVIALDGELDIEGKKVPIQHVSLEEDAARKMGEKDSIIRYRIDRLGIPLIEVTTAPVIYSPQEAEETALAIGRTLRATQRVKRGLGTIRQDLNISIRDGALTEIKGVQQLELVSKVVEYEVQRQLGLLKIKDELKKRGVTEESIKDEFMGVTPTFKQTECRVIQKALSQNQQVLAVKLPKFAGLLKMELAPGMRLGMEIADIAHFWGRVGGIFHTDELPAYRVTAKETDDLKKLLKAEPQDAVVFVADSVENATDALKAVTQRAREAVRGVPEETRAANPDGTSRYMRPRPGAARMYPETDVPPIQLGEEYVKKLRACLPELPEQKMRRLTEEYGLNLKLVRQILDSEYIDLFEKLAQETKVSPTVIAVALTETMKALRRDGVEVERVSDEQLRELFRLVDAGETAKEAIPEVITWLSKHEGATAKEAVETLGLTMIAQEELEKMIDSLMRENRSLIEERKEGAFGSLMGMVMKKTRGRVKAEWVSETLKKRLKEFV
ncbi:MAG: Glu-tRNA(Gln) amidotransferase subunit GatE [Candidatus Bathyarchaeota archaeon]|nr:Glu-tRNA(Gln) amidotransferase subunit GatE [Candidatus Bathyarchaeota archaeon]MDH5712418.1 Glu-tRNA(Gln) amidotransferase subunit GatE [Candidatus Bathyarchaeota archaeon]